VDLAAPTGDFVRVGVPFSAAVMVVSVLLAGWLFPSADPAEGRGPTSLMNGQALAVIGKCAG
jgi:hypothetical protein